ncbi:hypothetical protein NON20_03610 [Synechocystis sp. B12]|nr:hypothetical protein NON20_03610 [Synechocystis sp. B12]
MLQTAPTQENLRCVIMPADLQQRPNLEALAPTLDWHQPDDHCVATVVEPGAVQFFDGRLFIGQISQLVTSPLSSRPGLSPTAATNGDRQNFAPSGPTAGHRPPLFSGALVAKPCL